MNIAAERDDARLIADACLARADRLRHRWGMAASRRTTGRVLLLEVRHADAAEMLAESVAGFERMGLAGSAEIARGYLRQAQDAVAMR